MASDGDGRNPPALLQARELRFALTVFLAVVTSFFALMMSAYSERMELGDWVPLGPSVDLVNTPTIVATTLPGNF